MVTVAEQYKLKIGEAAPKFSGLKGVDGKTYALDSFKDMKALLVVWHCNHCPYAQAYESRLNDIAKDYQPEGLGVLAINSNDAVEYPQDDLAHMVEHHKQRNLVFPYVFDESQAVAEAFGAVCTPHVFLFDQQRLLRYQGRFDGEKDNPKAGKAREARAAIDAVLAGQPVKEQTTHAFGCSIKWNKAHFAKIRPQAW